MKTILSANKINMVARKSKKIAKKKTKLNKKAAPRVPKRRVVAKKKIAPKKKTAVLKKRTTKHAHKVVHAKKGSPLTLVRHAHNPIIAPSQHFWESKWVFNPSAILHDGKIHLVYRAVGGSDVSMVGYAHSSDGFTVDGRYPEPAFYHRNTPEGDRSEFKIPYSSGGGFCGGSEDPRITLIGDRVYMLFTAFDGWSSIRIGMTWLELPNFLNRIWKWKKPVFISPPNEVHKNWLLFPEKINGKQAILHSISPEVSVAYVDSLDEFDGKKFIKSEYKSGARRTTWDNWIRGAGPSPIKTKYGWLLLYHAMDVNDPNRYKLGAMLLDLKNPEKVLYRSSQPILEPDEWYENEGFKAGVIYASGAVIKDGLLLVYYGGADTVCCVAAADAEKFLKKLMTEKTPLLTRKNKTSR